MKRDPKPPIRIKWYVWVEGYMYHVYTDGEEDFIIKNYLSKVLIMKSDCVVHTQDNTGERRSYNIKYLSENDSYELQPN